MRQSLLWETAIKSIFKNRRRSILTMLGIIIGIAAVITIVAIGNGFKRDMMDDMNAADTTGQTKYININYYNASDMFSSDEAEITKSDLEMVKSIDGVADTSYFKQSKEDSKQVSVNFYDKDNKVTVSAEPVKSTDLEMEVGRQLRPSDSDSLNKVTVIDDEIAQRLYGSAENALNKGFDTSGQVYTIVGVTKPLAGPIAVTNYNTHVYFPKKTYEYYNGRKQDHSTLAVTFQEGQNKEAVLDKVLKQLNLNGEARQYGNYQEYDPNASMKQMGDILDQLTLFITAVAAISLLIAGVGVMNMMYISVSERTKEIGIRRALGARASAIKRQFLFEGIALTLVGGIIGYLLGMLIAFLASIALPFSVRPDLLTIAIAIGVSTLIGVAFSYFPASAAAKKDLIDIMK